MSRVAPSVVVTSIPVHAVPQLWRCAACGFTHYTPTGGPLLACPTCAEQARLATLSTPERLAHRRAEIARLRGVPLAEML